MRKVLKYGPLEPDTDYDIPGDPVHFGYKSHQLYIWSQVFDDEPRTTKVRIYGTGWAIEDTNAQHFASVVSKGGFVWHCFLG